MLRRRPLSTAGLAVVFALALAGNAGAQTFPSTLTPQCVGGVLGCRQVDFLLLLGPGNSTTLNTFSIVLTSPGWALVDPNMSDATDSAGDDPFLDPTVHNPRHVSATFLFGALVNDLSPLRMRFELATAFSDASTLSGRYVGGSPADPNAVSGSFGPTTIPEPLGVTLLGAGLAVLGLARRRARSRPGDAARRPTP